MCKEGQKSDYSEGQYYELASEVALILKDRIVEGRINFSGPDLLGGRS
jgi:hypothetical protein